MLYVDLNSTQSKLLDSPSLYNTAEAEYAAILTAELLTDPRLLLDWKDIAIIAPFRYQVIFLRKVFRAHPNGKLGSIRIGTVEDYQACAAIDRDQH